MPRLILASVLALAAFFVAAWIGLSGFYADDDCVFDVSSVQEYSTRGRFEELRKAAREEIKNHHGKINEDTAGSLVGYIADRMGCSIVEVEIRKDRRGLTPDHPVPSIAVPKTPGVTGIVVTVFQPESAPNFAFLRDLKPVR